MGYDRAFVSNMWKVVRLLREEPEARIQLTDGPDAICTACPHLAARGCSRGEGAAGRVRLRDAATLRLLGLEPGASIAVAAAYALVRERLTPRSMAEEVCAGCEWRPYGYCAAALLRLQGRTHTSAQEP